MVHDRTFTRFTVQGGDKSFTYKVTASEHGESTYEFNGVREWMQPAQEATTG